MNTFVQWLFDELNERKWSQSELSRRANISKGQVSNVISEVNSPGLDFCVGVAKAFGYDAADVCRMAGLLPANTQQKRQSDPQLDRACSLFASIAVPSHRDAALLMLQSLAEQPEAQPAPPREVTAQEIARYETNRGIPDELAQLEAALGDDRPIEELWQLAYGIADFVRKWEEEAKGGSSEAEKGEAEEVAQT